MLEEINASVLSHFDRLIDETTQELNNLSNIDKQLKACSTIVNNFVTQTVQLINDNEDKEAVNEVLANSLLQINSFIASRPQNIESMSNELKSKLSAFTQASDAFKTVIREHFEKREAQLDHEEKIKESLNEQKKHDKRRKIGEKPEKLRDIRNIEAELNDTNIVQEDI